MGAGRTETGSAGTGGAASNASAAPAGGARAGTVAVAYAAACALAGSVGVATVLVAQAVPGYSPVDDPVVSTVVILGIGWSACLVGVIAWRRRPRDRTGVLLLLAGVTWLGAQWASPGTGAVFGVFSATAFTTGLVLIGAVPVLVALLGLTYPGGRLETPVRRTLASSGFVVLVAVLGVAATVFFDPAGQGCSCPDNLLLVANDPEMSSALSRLGLALGTGWALVTAAHLIDRLMRARPAARSIGAPVVVPSTVYLALTAGSFGTGARRGHLSTSGVSADLRLAQAAALLVVAGGVGWGLLRARRVQAALARSVVRQTDAPGRQLRADLADLLGDPALMIAHRMDDGRVVDSDGRAVDPTPQPGQAVTELSLSGAGVLLIHQAGLLDSPVLRDGLTSAAGLALTNDRLRARTLDQISELQSSQLRIVRAGDDERRRLERDLHDGAQQRLVGILLGLRLLRGTTDAPPALLEQAEDELSRAIADLRTLSHGLFSAVLADEGLSAALHGLAETRPVTVGAMPTTRLPVEVESTAYFVITRAASAGAVRVDATQHGERLTVDILLRGVADLRGVRDRVSAVGGTVTIGPGEDDETTRIVVVLPGEPAGS
jgi:signal transduction histidine kinase